MQYNNGEKYIDLLLSNSVQTQANQRVAINFKQNVSQPILNSTNGYQLSIIRFSLNTETLPVFIPTMQNKTTTIYSITMEYNGQQYQKFMEFAPQNLNPVDADEYYYIYNYQYLIYLVNKCFADCYAGLNSVVTGTQLTGQTPTMSFDSATQKCTISFDTSDFGYNETNKINIYMNNAMYALFASLPSSIMNKDNLGMDYQLDTRLTQSDGQLSQEYSTVPLWNPVSSIIFTSNLIPICHSEAPPIEVYENGSLLNNSSSSDKRSVITDFIANDLLFVPYIQYSASVYRYLSLKPNVPIGNLDLQVLWTDKRTGKLKPVYMGVGGACNVKILLSRI
jgi:hypothetical protein